MAFTQPWFEADFGSAYAAIGTTGYRLYKNDNTDSVARTTAGVVDLGNGGYGVPAVNVPDDATGIEWDTGGGSPVYAREDIEPYRDRDSILVDTNEIQGKLPANFIMGSSVTTNKDDEIDAIMAVTDLLPNAGALTDIDTGINNIEAKLPTNYIMGSGVVTDKDDEIDDILADTEVMQPLIDQSLSATESNIRGSDSDDLKDISDQIDGLPSASAISTQVWTEALPGAFGAGSAGIILGGDIPGEIEDIRLGDGIYVSSVYGSAGTAYPIGTKESPSSNLTDATTIATARGKRKFIFLDTNPYLLPQGYTNWVFQGELLASINVNGKTVTTSLFEQLSISNAIGTMGTFKLCTIVGATNLGGIVLESAFFGSIGLGSAGLSIYKSVGDADVSFTPTFDCTNLSSGNARFIDFNGNLKFANLTAGTVNLIGCNGQITLNSSCTGGTVNLLGEIDLVNNAAGTNVVKLDALINMTEIADAVWDEILSGHTVGGSAGEALSAAAAGGNPATIAAAVWQATFAGYTTNTQMGYLMNKYLRALIESDAQQDTANNQWIIDDPDNPGTPLITFATKGAGGGPASINIYSREKV